MGRTAIAILSTENLVHNIHVLKKQVNPGNVVAMVKANAYGHGIRSVSSRIQDHVGLLGVASIDEAMALRKIGIKAPILLAEGVFEPSELIHASTEKFHVVFHNPFQVEWLEKSSLPLPLQTWLKVNTGMGRLGFESAVAKEYYDRLYENSQVQKPIRLMSHFACADEKSHPLNEKQIYQFTELKKKIPQEHECEYSFCNSAAIFHFPDHHDHYSRPGLALYGVSPLPDKTSLDLNLKPVMTVQSTLISIQKMSKGDSIGYGGRYQCPEDMLVGVVAFGYGDGYPLSARDGAPMLVNKTECSLIGRVSMDMINVDLRNCPEAKIGDPVTLWGQGLPVERVARHTVNIPYDILTGVQHRVKFLWTRE